MHNKIVNIHMVKFNYMFQKEIGDRVAHVLLSSAGLDQFKKNNRDSPWPTHGCYCTTCPADGFGKNIYPYGLVSKTTHIHMSLLGLNETDSPVVFLGLKRHIFTCRF